MQPIHFKIKPLHSNFTMPKQATSGAGGFDLYMPEAGEIPANGKVQVGLGFAGALPPFHAALLMPRSGSGTKFEVELSNSIGCIDSDYRGEFLATLKTKNGKAFRWKAGERLLQLLIVPVPQTVLEIVDTLDDTERGTGGHGSTGA